MFNSLLTHPNSLFGQFDRLHRELDEILGASGLPTSIRSVATGTLPQINVGRTSGIRVGDRFTIHRMGEPLIDPVTKMNLGSTEEQVGTGVVTEVQDRFAVITVTGTAAASDVIRKAP